MKHNRGDHHSFGIEMGTRNVGSSEGGNTWLGVVFTRPHVRSLKAYRAAAAQRILGAGHSSEHGAALPTVPPKKNPAVSQQQGFLV